MTLLWLALAGIALIVGISVGETSLAAQVIALSLCGAAGVKGVLASPRLTERAHVGALRPWWDATSQRARHVTIVGVSFFAALCWWVLSPGEQPWHPPARAALAWTSGELRTSGNWQYYIYSQDRSLKLVCDMDIQCLPESLEQYTGDMITVGYRVPNLKRTRSIAVYEVKSNRQVLRNYEQNVSWIVQREEYGRKNWTFMPVSILMLLSCNLFLMFKRVRTSPR